MAKKDSRNVEIILEGQTKKSKGVLVIEIDLDKDLGPSKSGKSTIIGSTSGAATLEEYGMPEIRVNCNVYSVDPKKGRTRVHRGGGE